MKKFDVEITETLQRTVSVEAASQEEAEKIVTKAWNNEDYVLDSADFVGVDFKTVGEQELFESRKMEVLLVQPGMYPQKATIGIPSDTETVYLKDLTDSQLEQLGVPAENDVLTFADKTCFRSYIAVLEDYFAKDNREISLFN